jgi:uncharacterized protein (TIGR03435 family)
MRATRFAIFLVALALTSVAGDVGSQSVPAFEIASIKANTSGTRMVNLDYQAASGRFTATNITLDMLIRVAYGDGGPLPPNRLVADAEWIGKRRFITGDHFDIVAKADGHPPQSELPAMLRGLLADRFRLAVHHETREQPAYALVAARNDGRLGPRLRKSDIDCSTVKAGAPPSPGADFVAAPCAMRSVPGKASGRAVTMDALARAISGWVDDHRVIANRTGLDGAFDLDLDWMPTQPLPPDAPAPPSPAADAPSLFTAIQEQLGLKLETGKEQIDILVVDHAERPTAN